MSTDREPKPKMRRFRAGLLAFLAFALAIGAGLAWVAVIVKRAHDQRQIVAKIRQAGGEAYYDYQVVDEHVDPTREPPGTRFLQAVLGDDVFANVHTVTFVAGSPKDGDVERLAELPELTDLRVRGDGITDRGVAELKKAIPACAVQCWDVHGVGIQE